MITALKYLKDADGDFSCDQYDFDAITDIEDELNMILTKRQTDASADWKALGEKLSGCEIGSFDLKQNQEE